MLWPWRAGLVAAAGSLSVSVGVLECGCRMPDNTNRFGRMSELGDDGGVLYVDACVLLCFFSFFLKKIHSSFSFSFHQVDSRLFYSTSSPSFCRQPNNDQPSPGAARPRSCQLTMRTKGHCDGTCCLCAHKRAKARGWAGWAALLGVDGRFCPAFVWRDKEDERT